ncbi:FAD-dependent thymidylate synthase [Victivallaceae bacterium BBE-744-WT-12]|uniref:Flavin-dependent thymidylate synthase n=2 Tax=Victivallis lenta TaxID=2606640 RepID=A0A844FYY0_9BACT|nr:thymidylate synthase (FAD) [Victivallales bacterium CCUG 44730]MST96316.1 FAD-dependent thymidylate synthase [Victivallis lenta]HBP05479.1 FAD-dependent thymidylate synthase [Lentisphaeria bacterium]HCH85526.1 FAD-dependent thymidylate synthase [Lentisphaeria bacterium]
MHGRIDCRRPRSAARSESGRTESQIKDQNMEHLNVPPANHVKVLDGQGWVGLIDHLGTEATIVNAARVSFGKLKSEMDERDVGLLSYLIANRHTSPLEHMVFTFSIHCPLFIRGQWHRHRTWSYNEISRRYTEIDMEFYTPSILRRQSENNRQASFFDPEFDGKELREEIRRHNEASLKLYERLIASGVCREQARGVLPQNMMVTFWGTVDLANLLHFLDLRDSDHAQAEIREYAKAIKQLIKPLIPNVAAYFEKQGQEW